MSQEFHELTVSRVTAETPDSRTFELEVPSALRERFAYAAGQFVTLEIPWHGLTLRRCYSLCTAPGLQPQPAVTVKRVAEGRVSNWLIDRVAAGDSLRVSPPEGRFVLRPEDAGRPLILFAAGSGITPVMSLLETALHEGERRVALFYANRSAEAVIFAERLQQLASQHPDRFELCSHLDDAHGPLTPGALGAWLEARAPGPCYVCGPAGFMEAAEAALSAAGVPEADWHFERFVSPLDPDQRPASNVDEAALPCPTAFAVTLDGRRHEVPYRAGQTLLEAAQGAELAVPSSCESGYCGSCMAQLQRGAVHMRCREALTDRNVEQGRVLLCQALPRSAEPLEIDCDATSFRIETQSAGGGQLALRRAVAVALTTFVAVALWILRTRG